MSSADLLTTLRYAWWTVSGISTIYLVRHYVVDWGLQSGPSMYATMASEEHIGWFSRLHRRGRGIKVGDIVHAENPLFPGKLTGKRVMGMPGDYVVVDPPNSPSVGGAVMEGIFEYDKSKGEGRAEPRMVQVPEGHVWLVGDNLAWSRDSRTYGPVPMALIRAKALVAFRGFTDWKYFDDRQLVPVEEDGKSERMRRIEARVREDELKDRELGETSKVNGSPSE